MTTETPKPVISWSPEDGNERLLSIDVGITHFAYMLLDITNVKILLWDVVDLRALALAETEYFTTYIGLRPAKRGFTNARAGDILGKWLDENILPMATAINYVLIEQQQTGIMRVISHELQIYFRSINVAYLKEHGTQICVPTFMSPKLKTQLVRSHLRNSTYSKIIPTDEQITEMTRSQRYTMNKKHAVYMVEDVLTDTHPWRAWFMYQHAEADKVDDLADVLVQALAYIQLRTEDDVEKNKRKQLIKERAAVRLAQKMEERKKAQELKEKQKAEKELMEKEETKTPEVPKEEKKATTKVPKSIPPETPPTTTTPPVETPTEEEVVKEPPKKRPRKMSTTSVAKLA